MSKFKVGDRVRRNPKDFGGESKAPKQRGTIIAIEGKRYRVWWSKFPKAFAYSYLSSELVLVEGKK